MIKISLEFFGIGLFFDFTPLYSILGVYVYYRANSVEKALFTWDLAECMIHLGMKQKLTMKFLGKIPISTHFYLLSISTEFTPFNKVLGGFADGREAEIHASRRFTNCFSIIAKSCFLKIPSSL